MLRHFVGLFIGKKQYPRIIDQRTIPSEGRLFEVTNEVEEWRVNSLDDEQDFLEELLDNLEPDDVLYDIGSCIGIYSLYAALHCRQVYAFEPDFGFQQRITRNIQLNGTKNIITLQLAVSDRSGEVTLYTDGINGRSPSLEDFGQKNSVKVSCESLDRLVFDGKIEAPNIIKMDVEGAEFLALSGARNLLKSGQKPRAIFLELHPSFLERFGHSSELLEKFLVECGYRETKRIARDTQYHLILEA